MNEPKDLSKLKISLWTLHCSAGDTVLRIAERPDGNAHVTIKDKFTERKERKMMSLLLATEVAKGFINFSEPGEEFKKQFPSWC